MFALLGILVMVAANNFLVVYLGLELMSLSLYAHGGACAATAPPPPRRR